MLFAEFQLSEIFAARPAVLATQVGILTSLLVGTVVRWLASRSASPEIARKRMASLKTWWVMAILFCLALTLGRFGGVLFFLLVSVLALKEFMALTAVAYADWRLVGWAYVIVILNYVWIFLGWREMFAVFVPLCSLLLLAARMVVREKSGGFLMVASSLHWGLMLTVYCVAHAPLLLTLPESSNPAAGSVGWFLYVILLTAISDISQALVGRRFGRRAIAPVLSPHKTWEGLIGGIVITALAAALLAPAMTSLADASLQIGPTRISTPYLPAVLAGLIISIGGYFGDLTISGVKRDLGQKDSGTMLPGQGGILDRIDSLTFSAPLFYYFLLLTS